jgi:hypothetical protein
MRLAVRDRRDISAWRHAFVPLAVRRCEPFLAEAGVPQLIACAPNPARRIARRFLEATPSSIGAAEARQLLAKTFDALAAYYGERTSRSLYSWARRHEVDRRQWLRWRILGDVLPPLAGAEGWVRVPPQAWLPQSTYETFRKVVRTLLDSDAGADLASRVSAAEALPLSRAERALLAYDENAIEPGEETHMDDLTIVELMVRQERVVRAWIGIRRHTTPDERRALVRWARLEAPRFNLSAEAIAALV